MKKQRSIIVTVSDSALSDIQRVADALAQRGMSVKQVLPNAGVISGSIDSTVNEGIRDVDGVDSIEDEIEIQLPPEGSPQ